MAIGNGSVDDLTVTASLASSIPIKTTNSYNIGSATLGLQFIFLGSSAGSNTTKLSGAAVASDYTYTFPLTGGTDGYVQMTNGSGTTSFQPMNLRPGEFSNFGLASATTSSSGDSIKITGATAAFSSTNPGWVCLPSTATPGLTVLLKITSDVTIDLTGAHWGLGGGGDETDYTLSVYAINDAGTLKWGVSATPGLTTALNADDSTTTTSITQPNHILVNTALGADAGSAEIGWFKADFDDTGGASEDLWSVSSALGDLNMGPSKPMWKSFVPTGAWVTNTTYAGKWKRVGDDLFCHIYWATSGAPTTSPLTLDLPSGFVIDTNKLPNGADTDQVFISEGSGREDGGAQYRFGAGYTTTTAIIVKEYLQPGSNLAINNISQISPWTWGANDDGWVEFKVPISGW